MADLETTGGRGVPRGCLGGTSGSDRASLCGTLSRAVWAPSSFDFPAWSSLRIVIYTHVDHIYVPGRKKNGGLKVRRGMPAEIAL